MYEKTRIRLRAAELLREALMPHVIPVAAALAEKAKEGDVPAIKEFHDRIMGKAIQPVEGTGPEGEIIIRWQAENE
jgi:hypothetical protein